jgi:hypothetical protein
MIRSLFCHSGEKDRSSYKPIKTNLFAPGHLSVMMYSTMLQSLIMLRVAFVRMRAGESHAQYSIVIPAKNTECKAMSEKPTETL